ncbi:hypothetical protein KIW84_075013 [Lathyrus oleraceus]|uniref:FAR1 domain-containing protein n=1 Tax=Pisum sativum TaxID=3888 RepID=A0A9D4VTS1_PEA|nr:hypothetical protein KIW84_075013 [Pisum sativum]
MLGPKPKLPMSKPGSQSRPRSRTPDLSNIPRNAFSTPRIVISKSRKFYLVPPTLKISEITLSHPSHQNSCKKTSEMENLPKICVDTTDAFMTTERFGTREEVIRWIKEVGIDNKVTVIISRSDTETGKRGRSNKIIFGCDKGGKHKISDSGTQSASKKCGCPFKIRLTPAKDGSGWKIDVKCGLHNHGLPDRLEGHSFIGRLTTDEKQHVADLAKRHVAPRNILLSLQDKFPENVTRITHMECDRKRDKRSKE